AQRGLRVRDVDLLVAVRISAAEDGNIGDDVDEAVHEDEGVDELGRKLGLAGDDPVRPRVTVRLVLRVVFHVKAEFAAVTERDLRLPGDGIGLDVKTQAERGELVARKAHQLPQIVVAVEVSSSGVPLVRILSRFDIQILELELLVEPRLAIRSWENSVDAGELQGCLVEVDREAEPLRDGLVSCLDEKG